MAGEDGEIAGKPAEGNAPIAPSNLAGLSGLPPLDLAIFRTSRVQERLASFREHLLRSRQELLRLAQINSGPAEKQSNVLGGLPTIDFGSLMKPRLKRLVS
jgi:hypothetical protein